MSGIASAAAALTTAPAGVSKCTLSGTLGASASTANVTSSTRAVTVPAGNSGQLAFTGAVVESGTLQYSKNGGAFTIVGAPVTFANTDTIAVRGLAMTASTAIRFDLVDVTTGLTIESVTIQRT